MKTGRMIITGIFQHSAPVAQLEELDRTIQGRARGRKSGQFLNLDGSLALVMISYATTPNDKVMESV
jgi:hypothetical protein